MKWIAALTLTLAAFAQETPPPKPATEQPRPQEIQRVFELHYVEPNEVRNLLSAFPAAISPVNNLRMIAVRGSKETLDVIEQALKRIDVPRPAKKNIEFTGYMVMASTRAGESSETPDLAPVIKQLKSLFPYQSYRVMETFFLRTRDGDRGSAGGFITDANENIRHSYHFKFSGAQLTMDRQVKLNDVSLNVKTNAGDVGFNTELDFKEGQKVVVGKSNLTGGNALILILAAKVAE